MTEITSAQSTAPPQSRRHPGKMLGCLLGFAVIVFVWFCFVSAVAPARVAFSSPGGALAAIFTPPLLLAVLVWTGIRYFAAPLPKIGGTPVAAIEPVPPASAHMPATRFRIGAWSALTPQGDALKTVALSKARKTAFKPDQAIRLANGNPAHASMVSGLRLDAEGLPANTRLRVPRITAMLVSILNDLHSQQTGFTETIAGAVAVYWVVPEAMVADGLARMDVFAAAWKRSAWRGAAYTMHAVPAARSATYTLLSALQYGIDESAIPCAIVIAADSLIDGAELESMQDDLFSDAAPHGFIPAEGAAGLLLLDPGKSPEDMWIQAATLAPVKTIAFKDNITRKDIAHGLGSAVAGAIHAAQKAGEDVNFVVSNADHRAEGIVQISNMMVQELAHLDPLEERLSPMEYAGSFGAASDLVHLALAVEVACADGHVVCAVSNTQAEVASVLILPALV